MKITNRANLNQSLVNAIMNDPYDRGESDITVTQLIGPTQIRHLINKHWDEIGEDAIDRIWSLLGQAVHTILERSGDGVKEERLYLDVLGWKLGGQFDRLAYSEGILEDYKVTSAWSFIGGVKPEWETQLNVLAELCRINGYQIKKLKVIAIYRDWSKFKALQSAEYPKAQLGQIDIPLWSEEKCWEYIEDRIRLHQGPPQPCSQIETWYSGDRYAVMKKGRKSAVRVLDSTIEADEYIKAKDLKGHAIVHRPGVYKRCQDYCSVSKFCPQFNEL